MSRTPAGCHNARVNISKLTTTDGFLVIDLPDATVAVGVMRCARKLLQDGAVNLARSTTYSFAAFGFPVSGASAAVNAEGEGRDAAVAAAVNELADEVAAGRLLLRAAKGVAPVDLASWSRALPELGVDAEMDAKVAGVVAATATVLGTLAGSRIAVEDTGPVAERLVEALSAEGAAVTRGTAGDVCSAQCDALIVGSKPGLVDHDVASGLRTRFIVASGPLPVTARALAVARRNGCEVVPDFISLGGPLIELGSALAGAGAKPDVKGRVAEVLGAASNFPDGLYLGACFLAEEFLRTWTDDLPFGRPLA